MFVAASERALQRTSTAQAPWAIVEGADQEYRSLTVATTIRDAIRKALDEGRGQRPPAPASASSAAAAKKEKPVARGKAAAVAPVPTILNSLDMSQAVPKQGFSKELAKYQGRLHRLARRARAKGVSTIMVFEGWDAAGKGGAFGASPARSTPGGTR